MTPASARRSLRRRILTVGVGIAIFTGLGLVVLVSVGIRQQVQLRAATDAVIEEQRTADAIIHGMLRQLAAVSMSATQSDTALRREFEEAGSAIYDGLRQYLFRPLSVEERLQIERVKEEHQQLEVSAERALRSGVVHDAAASERRDDVVRHASGLLEALDGFVRMREHAVAGLLQRQARVLQWLSFGGAVCVAVFVVGGVVLIARFFQRRVTDPLDELTRAAVRIGRGDLGVQVPNTWDAEFHTLADGFNDMSSSLAHAREDLERRNEALTEAFAKVRTTQADLLQAEKLGAIGRMTAGLAHELNNPLATVLGYSELLAATLDDHPATPVAELRTNYVEPILREARRSRLLVRSLLQFARRSDSEVGPVRLRDALRVVVELRRFAFEQAGVRLLVDDIPDTVVIAERQRMQAVFLNIMNNALDVMAPRGHGVLRVDGRVEAAGVTVRFEDDGPGLADPSRVFEAFYTTKGVGEGTGLGLALAERFMHSFGGGISVENRAEGGARFIVRFARSDDAPSASTTLDTPPHASALPLRRAPRRQHVLVVEDEPHLQRLHRTLLTRLDVDVHVAGSVAEARPLLEARPFDVVISDVKMPGESGIALYRWVQAEQPALVPRFLFVTGDVSAAELGDIAQERPDAFLLKPFDAREYLARVASLLS